MEFDDPSVPVTDAVLLPVAVFELVSVLELVSVFEPVSFGDAAEEVAAAPVSYVSVHLQTFNIGCILLPGLSLTTRDSSSGNHRGHGHAAANVDRYNKNMVKICRFRVVLILTFVFVDTLNFETSPKPPKLWIYNQSSPV